MESFLLLINKQQTALFRANGPSISAFSSFKNTREVIIRPALEVGVSRCRISQHELGDYLREIFHETEFSFAIVPRLLMRKICAETPPPQNHRHPPKSTRVIPANMKQAVRDHKENKSGLFSRELALWNPIVPIEYIMWGLMKLLGVLSVPQINCSLGSAPPGPASIAASKCRRWWSADSWHQAAEDGGAVVLLS